MWTPRSRQLEHSGKTCRFCHELPNWPWPRLRKVSSLVAQGARQEHGCGGCGFKEDDSAPSAPNGMVLCLGRTSGPGRDSMLLTVNLGEFCGRTSASNGQDTVLSSSGLLCSLALRILLTSKGEQHVTSGLMMAKISQSSARIPCWANVLRRTAHGLARVEGSGNRGPHQDRL
jgi:hypothetical protein